MNEELEENHVQAERELMEQLEQRDTVIRDQLAAVDTARERVADYENTIVQFRQLTQNLQRFVLFTCNQLHSLMIPQ